MKNYLLAFSLAFISVTSFANVDDTLAKYAVGKSLTAEDEKYEKAISSLKEFSQCVRTEDFWAAYDKYGFNRHSYGTANGIYVHCLKETNLSKSCVERSYMEATLSSRHGLQVLESPANIDISGHGAGSQDAIFTGISAEGSEYNMSVKSRGHSNFYYIDSSIDCSDDHFGGCRQSTGLSRSCINSL